LQKSITHTIEQDVRFSEVDSLGIVWHGHYVQYFEDGREAFGKKYNLRYLDFYDNGYVVPIVSLQCDFKRSLRYGDRMIIETTYIPTASAKLNFEYKIINAGTNELIITGSTSQVFLSSGDLVLQLTNPQFFQDWKETLNLI
jgi:acyl-CoA thioester hydrolase